MCGTVGNGLDLLSSASIEPGGDLVDASGQIEDIETVVSMQLVAAEVGMVLEERIQLDVTADISLLSGEACPLPRECRAIGVPDEAGEAIGRDDVDVPL